MKPALMIKPDASAEELRETLELCLMETREQASKIRDEAGDCGIYDLLDVAFEIVDTYAGKIFRV